MSGAGNFNVLNQAKVLVVTARFNPKITNALHEGAIQRLLSAGLLRENIVEVRVPGAVEIPLALKWGLQDGSFSGAIALGAVVRGETAHFDYVCNSVERGCSQLQLDLMLPIAFGVITTENADQSYARTIGRKGNKGAEAAEVVLEMMQLKSRLLPTK